MRDDFPQKTKESLSKRAGYICSNPNCRKSTIAPSPNDDTKIQYVGVCAHITAAQMNGPRFANNLTQKQRKEINNGIFLCATCATLIDKNKGIDYSKELLIQWKEQHEKWIKGNINKKMANEQTIKEIAYLNEIKANAIIVIPTLNCSEKTTDDLKVEHDRNLFLRINKMLGEKKLKDLLLTLEYNESIKMNDTFLLSKVENFLLLTTNEFINAKIEAEKKWYAIHLGILGLFCQEHFDKYPYHQNSINFQICLSPQTNADRGGYLDLITYDKHKKLHADLVEVLNKVLKSYSRFRYEIKHTLII